MNSGNRAAPMLFSMKVLSFAFSKKTLKNYGNTMLSPMSTQRHTEKFVAVPFTAILTCSTCVSQKVWNTYLMFLSNNCLKQCLERFTSLEIFFQLARQKFYKLGVEVSMCRESSLY